MAAAILAWINPGNNITRPLPSVYSGHCIMVYGMHHTCAMMRYKSIILVHSITAYMCYHGDWMRCVSVFSLCVGAILA